MADLQLVGDIDAGAQSPTEPVTVRYSAQNGTQAPVEAHRDYVALVEEHDNTNVVDGYFEAPTLDPSGVYDAEVALQNVPSGNYYMVYVYLDYENRHDVPPLQTGPVMVLGHFIQIQDQPAPTGTVQENQPFQIYYSAVNTAAGATPSQGHKDYIAVVDDPNDRNVFEHWHEQSQVGGNSGYGVTLDIPGLPAGDYLIALPGRERRAARPGIRAVHHRGRRQPLSQMLRAVAVSVRRTAQRPPTGTIGCTSATGEPASTDSSAAQTSLELEWISTRDGPSVTARAASRAGRSSSAVRTL